jgi:hypothetical protein
MKLHVGREAPDLMSPRARTAMRTLSSWSSRVGSIVVVVVVVEQSGGLARNHMSNRQGAIAQHQQISSHSQHFRIWCRNCSFSFIILSPLPLSRLSQPWKKPSCSNPYSLLASDTCFGNTSPIRASLFAQCPFPFPARSIRATPTSAGRHPKRMPNIHTHHPLKVKYRHVYWLNLIFRRPGTDV